MAIWGSKKFTRINWKNRPSTATALGATNLNKIDVFCNDVDNALILFDAQKLDIKTANSMLASVQYDQAKGQWIFKTLEGTTYTFDQNIEKIPVSFTLSEDGVLTMRTEDGTEWECNIAELIKDYDFTDSDTIAFSKEFAEEDDDGKGAYHVSALVKDGSIKEKHLDPDYRADILSYKTQAQEAANDSLQYSKDSQRWAVGNSSEYPGSETDNAKFYKEQAETAKAAAEQARDEAQAATGAVIMTPEKVGVGKPDNETIGVEEDGTLKLIAKAASLLITDEQELVVPKQEDVAQETTTQLLINAIAERVATKLVTNEALVGQLANYVTKAMMSNVQVNSENNVPTSALAYSMNQQLTQLNSDLGKKAAAENPTIKFTLTAGTTIELRRSGSTDAYELSLVVQKGDITTYHKLIDKDNVFCSEKVDVDDMHVLSIQEVSGSSTDTINNLESGSLTAAFKAVSGATRYHIIPIRCNYGYFSAISYSGTKITATATNASGEPHTLAATFLVVAYKD